MLTLSIVVPVRDEEKADRLLKDFETMVGDYLEGMVLSIYQHRNQTFQSIQDRAATKRRVSV